MIFKSECLSSWDWCHISRWSVLQKSSSFWVSCTPPGTNSFGVKTSWYSPRRPILKFPSSIPCPCIVFLVYRCTLCAKIFLFRRRCNGTQKSTPEIIDYITEKMNILKIQIKIYVKRSLSLSYKYTGTLSENLVKIIFKESWASQQTPLIKIRNN